MHEKRVLQFLALMESMYTPKPEYHRELGLALDELCDAEVSEVKIDRAMDIVEHQYKWQWEHQNRIDELALIYAMQNNATDADEMIRYGRRATELVNNILDKVMAREQELRVFVASLSNIDEYD